MTNYEFALVRVLIFCSWPFMYYCLVIIILNLFILPDLPANIYVEILADDVLVLPLHVLGTY